MFRIEKAEFLAPEVKRLEIYAPLVAKKHQPGQFVIVRVHEHGERIPLTVAATNHLLGTISLVVQGVGKTTKLLNSLEVGDCLLNVVGPLGKPSDISRFGTVVTIGGGVGTAIVLPISVALKKAGNFVISVLGARSVEWIMLEKEMLAASHETHIMTDDGTYGHQGLVTDKLREIIVSGRRIDRVFAVGPIAMMEAVAEETRYPQIKTIVSLNSIMIDGTGMCGGCRVLVGNQNRFTCIDGPDFDAHEVDFQILAQRNRMYIGAERQALSTYLEEPEKDGALVHRECKVAARYPEICSSQSFGSQES